MGIIIRVTHQYLKQKFLKSTYQERWAGFGIYSINKWIQSMPINS